MRGAIRWLMVNREMGFGLSGSPLQDEVEIIVLPPALGHLPVDLPRTSRREDWEEMELPFSALRKACEWRKPDLPRDD